MKNTLRLIWFLLFCVIAHADLTPTYPTMTTDVSLVLSPRTIRHIQASSATQPWRFINGTESTSTTSSVVSTNGGVVSTNVVTTTITTPVPYDLTGAAVIYFRYGPSDDKWGQSITGSFVNASNGSVTIPFTPENTATNGTYQFDIRVTDGSIPAKVFCRAYGDFILIKQAGATTLSFPTGTNVDLLNYTFINYPWMLSGETVMDATARAMAGSNTARIVTIEGGTSNWYAAYAHTTESSNTVHGGFIRVAYDWATNAWARAGLAWDQATNALAIAQTAFGWGDHADAGYVTGDVVRAEVDPVWGAVSNTVTANAAAGQAHAATEHRVEYCGGFSAGAGSVASSGGAVGVNAKTSDGFAGGYCAYATDNGVSSGNGIDAIQLGTGGNTIPLSFNVYSFTLLNPDGTIPLDRTPSLLTTNAPEWIAVTNGAALGETALQPASTNGWTVTSHDGLVPANRTITVNGQVGTLNSNISFTVAGGATNLQGLLDGGNTATNGISVGGLGVGTNAVAGQIAARTADSSIGMFDGYENTGNGATFVIRSSAATANNRFAAIQLESGGKAYYGSFSLAPIAHPTLGIVKGLNFSAYQSDSDVGFTTWSTAVNARRTGLMLQSGTLNVGIGTNNPSQKLEVVGSVKAQDRFYFGNGASLYASGSNLFFVVPDGSVTNPLTSNP